MIRVLFIMGNMGLGGAETQVMKLFRSINREKFCFDFCVNTVEKNYYEDEIYYLEGKVYRTVKKSDNPFRYFQEIYKIIKSNNYQIVVKCTENAAAWQEMFAAKLAGARMRVVRSTNTHVGNSKLITLVHLLSRPILNVLTTEKIAPSLDSGEWLFGKKHAKDVIVLANGIPTCQYRFNQTIRENLRREFGIENDEILIGTVGRMSHQKNQMFLLDLFCEVHKIHNNAKLIIVGDGELRYQLERHVQELCLDNSIIFTGKRDDVSSLLMAMDIFCLPSWYEGMPNCLIEAEATGAICCCSNTITKEANLTKEVAYLSIDDISDWVHFIDDVFKGKKIVSREKYADIVRKCGYDSGDISIKVACYIERRLKNEKET